MDRFASLQEISNEIKAHSKRLRPDASAKERAEWKKTWDELNDRYESTKMFQKIQSAGNGPASGDNRPKTKPALFNHDVDPAELDSRRWENMFRRTPPTDNCGFRSALEVAHSLAQYQATGLPDERLTKLRQQSKTV